MSAWRELTNAEMDDVWERFERRFLFRPSIEPRNWPGLAEPIPSVTYLLPSSWTEEQEVELTHGALAAFRRLCASGEVMTALDWEHPCYWFDPHQDPVPWQIPIWPNGDYYIYLGGRAQTWGTFGHPWERTLCVFGEEMVRAFEPPVFLGTVLRRR
jgi:hypothetical protein